MAHPDSTERSDGQAYPPASDVAFSDRVKAVQARKGSRAAYARMESSSGWSTHIDPDLREFIESQTSVFLATASADGQPYVQHRGGPPGFLHVLDEQTIAFADFDGNRQYITQGNLEENAKAQLFLIDYTTRQRVKIWGTAKVVEDNQAFVRSLMPPSYPATSTQAVVFRVTAWDANCRKHIPLRIDEADARRAIEQRDARITELEKAAG
jgi:predicted pyridoxine 5'-phosphate oxidase superfamily flavin-nucleotide-binding protein